MNIIVIGAQKAGTTWLYSMLKQNKGVVTAFQKEIHYFDNRCNPNFKFDRYRRLILAKLEKLNKLDRPGQKEYLGYCLDPNIAFTDEWYRNIFLKKPANQRVLAKGHSLAFLDASPSYMTVPEHGVAHMASVTGKTEPILLIRDPVSRMISGLTMKLLRTQDKKNRSSAEEIIKDEQISRGSYSKAIPLFRKHFGSIHIIPFKDIQTQPKDVLRSIEIKYQLPKAQYNKMGKKSNSKSGQLALSNDAIKLIKTVCEPEYDFLRTEFGSSFIDRI
jgi:Sulfotransferase family